MERIEMYLKEKSKVFCIKKEKCFFRSRRKKVFVRKIGL